MFRYDIQHLVPGKDFIVRWKIKGAYVDYYEVTVPWRPVDKAVCKHWTPDDEEIMEDDDLFFEELRRVLEEGEMPPEAIGAINEELNDIIKYYVDADFTDRVMWDTIGYGEKDMGKKSKVKGSTFYNRIATVIRDRFLPGIDSKTAYSLVHRTPLSGGHVERGDIIMKPPVLKYFPWFIECRNREVWAWKQIWERGEESVILKWFLDDADRKCHPYDNNNSETHHRDPLLLFTRNFQRVYFAAWEEDLGKNLNRSSNSMLGGAPIMHIYVDNDWVKGYVIIGDFDTLLSFCPAVDAATVKREVDEYLGEPYEAFDSG